MTARASFGNHRRANSPSSFSSRRITKSQGFSRHRCPTGSAGSSCSRAACSQARSRLRKLILLGEVLMPPRSNTMIVCNGVAVSRPMRRNRPPAPDRRIPPSPDKQDRVRFRYIRHGQAIYAPRIGAAITAFGRSKTPNPHSASASTCTGTRSGAPRSAAKTIAAPAPGDREQYVAPDDPDKDEGRRSSATAPALTRHG